MKDVSVDPWGSSGCSVLVDDFGPLRRQRHQRSSDGNFLALERITTTVDHRELGDQGFSMKRNAEIMKRLP